MGLFKKFAGIFMGDDIEDEEEMTEESGEETQEASYTQNTAPAERTVSQAPKTAELKVVRLSAYDASIQKVANHLLQKKTVVLILEDVGVETTRRIIDFFTGVAYAIDGQLKRINAGTYIVTPNNIAISNEQIQMAAVEDEAPEAYSVGSKMEEF